MTKESMSGLLARMNTLQESMSTLSGKVDVSNQSNNEIIRILEVLKYQQSQNTKYQDECTVERKEIREDIIRMKTQSATIATIISLAISGGALLAEVWRH